MALNNEKKKQELHFFEFKMDPDKIKGEMEFPNKIPNCCENKVIPLPQYQKLHINEVDKQFIRQDRVCCSNSCTKVQKLSCIKKKFIFQ